MATTISRLSVDLLLDSTRIQKGLDAAMKPLKKFGKEMTAIGKDLSVKVTAPVVGLGAGVLKAAGDFEAGMNRVGAILDATGPQFDTLRDKAKELGATTQFSATEAAGGIEMLGKNGLKYEAIVNGALDATLELSAATGSELSRAADIATDAMLAFKIKAEDMGSTVDQITGVTLNSKFDIEGYAYALANAGGVAASVGVDFKDFNATIAAIAPNFSSGMTAGTSFKTFLARLVPTSDPAIEAMNELGLSFFDAKGKMDNMATVAEKLKTAFGGLSDEDKLAKGIQIFGTEGVRAAFAIMDGGAESINKMKSALSDASAADQATARMQGLNGAMTKLRSAMEAVAIAVAESGLLEFATRLATKVTELFSKLSNVNPEILKWGTVIAGAAAAIGPLLLVVGQLAMGLTSVLALVGGKAGLMATFAALTGPIGLTVAAVGALTAVYLTFKEDIDAFLVDTFTNLLLWYDDLVEKINVGADAFFDWVSSTSNALTGWDTAVEKAFQSVVGWFKSLNIKVANLAQVFADKFHWIGLKVEQFVARIENWLADKLLKVTEAAEKGVNKLTGAFARMFDKVVGNSYVPDMVTRLEEEAQKMERTFIDRSIKNVQDLSNEFMRLGQVSQSVQIGPQAVNFKKVGDEVVLKDPGFNASEWFKLSERDIQNFNSKLQGVDPVTVQVDSDEAMNRMNVFAQRAESFPFSGLDPVALNVDSRQAMEQMGAFSNAAVSPPFSTSNPLVVSVDPSAALDQLNVFAQRAEAFPFSGLDPVVFKVDSRRAMDQLNVFADTARDIPNLFPQVIDAPRLNTDQFTDSLDFMADSVRDGFLRITNLMDDSEADWKDYTVAIFDHVHSMAQGVISQLGSVQGSFSGFQGGQSIGGFGGFGGGGGSDTLGIIGGIFSSAAQSFGQYMSSNGGFGGGFADGGRPPIGRISLVGERGPELFVPDTAGTILPNSVLAGVGSNRGPVVNVTQNNHFEAGVTQNQLADTLKDHGRALVRGITDQISRGGSMRQAFQG